ncbi:MAG: rhomboid family intramembrane serine protease [Akkermansiaceae bacterium]
MSDPKQEDSVSELEDHQEPVWARETAFPEAPEGFGWVDRKGVRHSCLSSGELEQAIRSDKDSSVNLVWTPEYKYCRVPEEIEDLALPIAEVRKQWAKDDFQEANHRIKWVGGGLFLLLAYMGYLGWNHLGRVKEASGVALTLFEEIRWIFRILVNSTTVGIGFLIFLIFAFIPWYQAWKRSNEIITNQQRPKSVVSLIRFETWLDLQKAPVTKGIVVLLALVFLVQALNDKAILGFSESIQKAGLVKPAYQAGEYWRLLTAPMLHGGVVHFTMNGLAALYLGKRLEVFARWPHLPAVFVFSALVAGEATARFADATSVGASGGLMGWLGFLLVFETLHSRLVPKSSRRRLIGGIILTGVIGLVGYKFIDNAAHAGGLVAGMAYAAIVFPKSSSVIRPNTNFTDRLVGFVSLGFIAISAVLAVSMILS